MCSKPSYIGRQVEKSKSSPTNRKHLHILNHITTAEPEEDNKTYTARFNLLQLGKEIPSRAGSILFLLHWQSSLVDAMVITSVYAALLYMGPSIKSTGLQKVG